MRASIAAEAAGVPTVSLVCEGFVGQAQATGRGFGYEGMALGVLSGHVDAQTTDEMEANVIGVVDQLVDGLTKALAETPEASGEPAATDIVASGSIDDINAEFTRQGWTDGSPIIPPTLDRVHAYLADTGHDPWRTVGTATSSGRDMTIWSIAVNAVMAGCRPSHLPVLIAAAEVLADPHYGSEHSGNTTGADALMIIDGPSIDELGLNFGEGALREGVHANTSIGRWLRLYQRNVLDFTADAHDKATFGNSTRVVLAEDMAALDEIGWGSVSADFGFEASDDVVTMARFNSGIIVGSVFGATPEQIVPYLADSLMRVSGWDLTHVYGLGQGHYRPLLILSPILARIFGRAGWSKDDLRAALYDQARMPAWRFEKLIGDWSNLTAGRRRLLDIANEGHLPPEFGESEDPDRLVPIVTGPDKFVVAVAGDPHRTNAYVLSHDGPHGDYVAKRIDRSFSTDLLCEVPPA